MSTLTLPDTSKARILVVGDVMLDRYWFGEVSRISPEAPVPVVHVGKTEERPGGAANVARNAAALGAQVTGRLDPLHSYRLKFKSESAADAARAFFRQKSCKPAPPRGMIRST